MTTSFPTAPRTSLDRARAAWLAGTPGAWAQYQTCLRQLDARPAAAPAPAPLRRRPRRPRARA